MRRSDIPSRPSVATLRVFAAVWALALFGSAGAAYFWWRNGAATLALAGLAVTAALLGFVRPAALRPVYVALLVLAVPLHWLLSRVLLATVFYFLLTPLGLLFRLIGRDALGCRFEPAQESYWVAKTAAKETQ